MAHEIKSTETEFSREQKRPCRPLRTAGAGNSVTRGSTLISGAMMLPSAADSAA